jgi:hypothetical protein
MQLCVSDHNFSFEFKGGIKIPKRHMMAVVAMAAVMFTASAQASTVHIDFGVAPVGGSPSYTGATLDTSTAFDFGGGLYVVNQIGSGDQSTLALLNLVSLSNPSYGSGNSGTLTSAITKSWTTSFGTFTETLTSFIANRLTPNALTLELAGTLSGPGGINQAAFAILNANQVGGPGNAVDWSLTNSSSNATPLPAAMPLFATGLGVMGLLGWRRRRKGATSAVA